MSLFFEENIIYEELGEVVNTIQLQPAHIGHSIPAKIQRR
jgi:hypothetical protein